MHNVMARRTVEC